MGFALPVDIHTHLTEGGFRWKPDPGYFAKEHGDYSLTLEPLVLDSGQFALGFYRGQVLILDNKLLIDVKPRPR